MLELALDKEMARKIRDKVQVIQKRLRPIAKPLRVDVVEEMVKICTRRRIAVDLLDDNSPCKFDLDFVNDWYLFSKSVLIVFGDKNIPCEPSGGWIVCRSIICTRAEYLEILMLYDLMQRLYIRKRSGLKLYIYVGVRRKYNKGYGHKKFKNN
jgi:hypothetical protein